MNNPKILIVDDEPFNISYLEQELEDSNYVIITAANGQEAVEEVKSESPDLILLDIMMPVMDGFEVLSGLKSDVTTRDIPIIVISADSGLQSVVKGIQMGAEDYLPKPFEPVLLHARISSSLEKKRLRDLQQLYLKNLKREFDIAREIQQGFLPTELPKVDGWEIAAYFKAAREVAGDFYDAFLLPDGNLVCVIGDVCGKGVGAALFMTLFRSFIRATSTTDYFRDGYDSQPISPEQRLHNAIYFTNNYIADTHSIANMFATVFIGIINIKNGTLSYMNCGNEPALLMSVGKTLCPLPPTGPVVGVIPDASFEVKQVGLGENDMLLMYTDGIPDALNENGEDFGNERFQGLLNNDVMTAGKLVEHVQEKLDKFIGKADQFDDITLLIIKREI